MPVSLCARPRERSRQHRNHVALGQQPWRSGEYLWPDPAELRFEPCWPTDAPGPLIEAEWFEMHGMETILFMVETALFMIVSILSLGTLCAGRMPKVRLKPNSAQQEQQVRVSQQGLVSECLFLACQYDGGQPHGVLGHLPAF